MSNAVANGLAGAGGGIIAQIITYPLQIVNTRQQTERSAKKKGLIEGERDGEYSKRGTLYQMIHVIKTEGWGGLYSGLKPSLVGTAASQGVYYYFYQVFKNKAEAIASSQKKKGHGDGTVGMFSWLVVAAIAGAINVLLTIPIWVLVTRMQTHTQAEKKITEAKKEGILKEASENNLEPSVLQSKLAELDTIKPRPYGTIHAMKEVYHEAGIQGFWKGIIPTLIMVCNPSIQFMIYETSLKRLRAKRTANKHGVKPVTALEVFLVGAVAKLGATVATYPLLVVKGGSVRRDVVVDWVLEAWLVRLGSWVRHGRDVGLGSRGGGRSRLGCLPGWRLVSWWGVRGGGMALGRLDVGWSRGGGWVGLTKGVGFVLVAWVLGWWRGGLAWVSGGDVGGLAWQRLHMTAEESGTWG